jgi:hypothetical protein
MKKLILLTLFVGLLAVAGIAEQQQGGAVPMWEASRILGSCSKQGTTGNPCSGVCGYDTKGLKMVDDPSGHKPNPAGTCDSNANCTDQLSLGGSCGS